ncbi:hypothetical protein GGU10DRAFT_432649 [Lentinula aff. detonsa]|uniref:Uncharacterized protein n=1 Tax=Lentinula aff. detonsa TaxID=2804958 RepID=A0AA38NDV3_9AGAR|nr:hypothetical protein GGU10DRAFT_432649 [Lentinula aff. detonsa]
MCRSAHSLIFKDPRTNDGSWTGTACHHHGKSNQLDSQLPSKSHPINKFRTNKSVVLNGAEAMTRTGLELDSQSRNETAARLISRRAQGIRGVEKFFLFSGRPHLKEVPVVSLVIILQQQIIILTVPIAASAKPSLTAAKILTFFIPKAGWIWRGLRTLSKNEKEAAGGALEARKGAQCPNADELLLSLRVPHQLMPQKRRQNRFGFWRLES